MKSSKTGKTVSIIILFTLLSTQVLLPSQALAAVASWTIPSGNNPTKVNTSDIVNPRLLMSVLNCTGIVNQVSKVVTDFLQKELNAAIGKLTSKAKQAALNEARRLAKEKVARAILDKAAKAAEACAVASAVQVLGSGSNGVICKVLQDEALDAKKYLGVLLTRDQATIDKIEEERQQQIDTAAKTAQAHAREQCINGIAVSLARAQLEKMTRSTLNWVASGFGGDPFFVRNVDSFMNSITTEIINKETKFFADSLNKGKYPYGQLYAQSEVGAYKSRKSFDSSVQQNLTNYLIPGATPQSFANDFSQGGWNGWMALTQNPQNNPLGFTMVVAQHTADLEAQRKANADKELTQGNGLLSQKKCVIYALDGKRAIDKLNSLKENVNTATNNLTLAQSNLRNYASDSNAVPEIVSNLNQAVNNARERVASANAALSAANRDPANKDCTSWSVVTPGSAIRDKISKTINSPETQLELVRTINDALTYLFTALLNRFQTQGLSSLASGPFESVSGGFGSNSITDEFGNKITQTGGGGGESFLPFDITKDLAAIIKTQRDYIDGADNANVTLDKVLPALGKLDYEIPGPNPNWEQNAGNTEMSSEPKFGDFSDAVDDLYGATSGMQTRGDSSYLQMATEGLSLTRDITTYDAKIGLEKKDLEDGTNTANVNIPKLIAIKRQVDAIVAQATARRNAERKKDGLPPIDQKCKSQ